MSREPRITPHSVGVTATAVEWALDYLEAFCLEGKRGSQMPPAPEGMPDWLGPHVMAAVVEGILQGASPTYDRRAMLGAVREAAERDLLTLADRAQS